MWNWFNCYLSGRHEYGVWCEPGTIFLRCMHCGKRTSGWTIRPHADAAHVHHPHAAAPAVAPMRAAASRVMPFERATAR